VRVRAAGVELEGDLCLPPECPGVVLFAHGSGSSRHSPRNRYVAGVLNDAGIGTLLFDLLTPEEERVDLRTRELRFDIVRLAQRVIGAVDWIAKDDRTRDRRVGLFGASTGAAAALVAAAARPERVQAVVSRGGRPDLAGGALPSVRAPTLLIVGGFDRTVIGLNQAAQDRMRAPVRLEIVDGATHLFEEPGTLEQVASMAARFFRAHLGAAEEARAPGEARGREEREDR
jgi:pimeloyl-ACP methyl ester carboxylesterase